MLQSAICMPSVQSSWNYSTNVSVIDFMQLCKPDDKVIKTKMATQSAVTVSLLLSVLMTDIHLCKSRAFCTAK